jgi:hypothetical protein
MRNSAHTGYIADRQESCCEHPLPQSAQSAIRSAVPIFSVCRKKGHKLEQKNGCDEKKFAGFLAYMIEHITKMENSFTT